MAVGINVKAVESMLVFWTMVNDRDKVSDRYIQDMAEMDEFKATFDDTFTAESFHKILSAVSNKELLNGMNKQEGRFWNYNLWMLEDMAFTQNMVEPWKTLNLDDLEGAGKQEVIVVPMNLQTGFRDGDRLYINFFKTMNNEWEEHASVDGTELKEYIRTQLEF